jgi:hypothetical protein
MQAENTGEIMEDAVPDAGVSAPIADQQISDAQEAIEDGLSDTADNKPKETEQDRNWRAMREKVEQLQREAEYEKIKREEYERLVSQHFLQQQQPQQAEVDEFADISPEDWMTYEQSRRLAEKLAEKKANEAVKKALEEDRKTRADQEMPARLKSQFQDFDAVVTDANVKQLKELEPDVALALSQIGDKYAQAVAAYKYIKKFVPEAMEQKEYKERVANNSKKPGTLNAQTSALSKAHNFERGLTPELQKQLYQEMVEAARNG